MGNTQLSKLTPVLQQSYVNDLVEEGLASGTIKKLYNILKNSLDHAVNMELIPSNPIVKVQHSNINTMLNICSHILPNMQVETANQLDVLLAIYTINHCGTKMAPTILLVSNGFGFI